MLRLTSGTVVEEYARVVEIAREVRTVIRWPVDPLGAPIAALCRIETAAAPIGQTYDVSDGLEDTEPPLFVCADLGVTVIPSL